MWHEARRQEKIIKTTMVDSAKRHERRRTFYESIRKDPAEFMQIHGRRMQIHVDSSKTSTDQSLLRKWQGDPEVLIDRFDVRAHLDYIPDASNCHTLSGRMLKDDVEELQCNFERYRILALNDFLKTTEAKHLRQIDARELCRSSSTIAHRSIHKAELEKKKKSAVKKAAIAFSYAGTETVECADTSLKGSNGRHGSDDGEAVEEEDNSADDTLTVVDVDKLGAEQAAQLNRIGTGYNIGQGVFCKMVSLDKKEQLDSAELKEIDRAKLALSGREAKADRALLKKRRALIIGRGVVNEDATTSLLSFLANMRKAEAGNEQGSSSSESDQRARGRIEFASSMPRSRGGSETALRDGASRSKGDAMQGPVLPPPEYRRLLELRRNRSPIDGGSSEVPTGSFRARSRSRERRVHRSRSRSVRRRRRKVSRSSSRSSSRRRRRSKRRRHSRQRRNSKRRNRSRRRDDERRGVRSKGREAKLEENRRKDEPSPIQPETKTDTSSDDGSRSMPGSERSVRSSMSDSEREKIERDNRRIRMRRVKRKLKEKEVPGSSSCREPSGAQRMDVAAKKLKDQMQRNLDKSAANMKAEEAQKYKEQLQERRGVVQRREDELLEESRLLRRRERERRRKEEERNERERESSDEEEKRERPRRRYRRRSPSSTSRSSSSR